MSDRNYPMGSEGLTEEINREFPNKPLSNNDVYCRILQKIIRRKIMKNQTDIEKLKADVNELYSENGQLQKLLNGVELLGGN